MIVFRIMITILVSILDYIYILFIVMLNKILSSEFYYIPEYMIEHRAPMPAQ